MDLESSFRPDCTWVKDRVWLVHFLSKNIPLAYIESTGSHNPLLSGITDSPDNVRMAIYKPELQDSFLCVKEMAP